MLGTFPYWTVNATPTSSFQQKSTSQHRLHIHTLQQHSQFKQVNPNFKSSPRFGKMILSYAQFCKTGIVAKVTIKILLQTVEYPRGIATFLDAKVLRDSRISRHYGHISGRSKKAFGATSSVFLLEHETNSFSFELVHLESFNFLT